MTNLKTWSFDSPKKRGWTWANTRRIHHGWLMMIQKVYITCHKFVSGGMISPELGFDRHESMGYLIDKKNGTKKSIENTPTIPH